MEASPLSSKAIISQSSHLLLYSNVNSKSSSPTRFCPTKPSPISAEQQQRNENKKKKKEIRVCTNRTCRRQGSLSILEVFSSIAPPHVRVNSCGCLGRCGAGPNLVVLPDGVIVGHCGTAFKAADTMSHYVCSYSDSDSDNASKNCLEALALRKRAQHHMSLQDYSQAHLLLSQAIDLKPFGAFHILYKDRSAARLALGDMRGALEDAAEALNIASDYSEAYISKGNALMAMEQFDAAEEAYLIALELDPSIRNSKSFKARIAELQEKLASANAE